MNERYFDGVLEEPVITLTDTPKAYGHVTVSKAWALANGERRHELNIGAGTLDRDITEAVSTLLHEAVHLYHLQEGVQDTSRGGRYHNKRFRESAEARDLEISCDPKIGWSITEPTEALIDFIIFQGWQDIRMNREGGCTATGGPGRGAGAVGGIGAPGVQDPQERFCVPAVGRASALPAMSASFAESATSPWWRHKKRRARVRSLKALDTRTSKNQVNSFSNGLLLFLAVCAKMNLET